jgi:hypothetical protein
LIRRPQTPRTPRDKQNLIRWPETPRDKQNLIRRPETPVDKQVLIRGERLRRKKRA